MATRNLGRTLVLAVLRGGQHDGHGRPNGDESRQHPQEQRRFVDGRPRRQLFARQKEAGAADRPAVVVKLGDLTGDHGRGVVGRPSVGVNEDDSPVGTVVGHRGTVPHGAGRVTRRRAPGGALGAVIAAAAIGVVAGALIGPLSEASGQAPTPELVVRHGDVIRVAGIPVGCRVVVRGVPPTTMLDCRRAGPLRGTYGVLFGRSNVRVVRFNSARDAQVVVKATHGAGVVCCTTGGR
jgi:hypothetical protein